MMLNPQKRTCSAVAPGPSNSRTMAVNRCSRGRMILATRESKAAVGSIISQAISLKR